MDLKTKNDCMQHRVRGLSILVLVAHLFLLPIFFMYASYLTHALQPLGLSSNRSEVLPNHLLVLDAWERMVNVQYAVRRLLHVAVDANFLLVEPFVYQSKVPLQLSLPELFERRNLTPQPASTYFEKDDLHRTRRYVPFHQFEQRFRSDQNRTYFIHAVLFLTWPGSTWTNDEDELANELHPLPDPFFWCDSNLKQLPGQFNRSTNAYHITPSIQVARVVCAKPSSLTNAGFFRDLFDTVRTHIKSPTLACNECISVAVANYRKHAFNSYSYEDGRKLSGAVEPLSLSRSVFDKASTIVQRNIGNESFVAIHLRSGKAYAILTQKRNYSAFEQWLSSCVERLVSAGEAKKMPIYVATDLFNDGWRGGETASPLVLNALREAKRKLSSMSMFRLHVENESSLVAQDHMGMSSAIDAAVVVSATHFIVAEPSNFGVWVKKLRRARGERSEAVRCAFRE